MTQFTKARYLKRPGLAGAFALLLVLLLMTTPQTTFAASQAAKINAKALHAADEAPSTVDPGAPLPDDAEPPSTTGDSIDGDSPAAPCNDSFFYSAGLTLRPIPVLLQWSLLYGSLTKWRYAG